MENASPNVRWQAGESGRATTPLPGREQYLDSILALNNFLREYTATLENFYFIDATDVMMKGGKTRPEYFVSDGIHLNTDGHATWTKLMKDKLTELEIPYEQ